MKIGVKEGERKLKCSIFKRVETSVKQTDSKYLLVKLFTLTSNVT